MKKIKTKVRRIAAVVALLCAGNAYAGSASSLLQLQYAMQTRNLVTQAAASLSAESVLDTDNYLLPPAMDFTSGGTVPTGGGAIPLSSLAVKTDGAGRRLGYCAWDNGTTTNGAGRLAGALPLSAPMIAVISAGPDGVFQTTCAQAGTGASSGDDVVVMLTVTAAQTSAGGNSWMSAPVPTAANLPTGSRDGEVRLDKSTNVLYRWDVARNAGAGAWVSVGGSSAARNISLTGDGTWAVSYDGSSDVSAALTLANTGVMAGTYGASNLIPVITVDSKGRVLTATTQALRLSSAQDVNVSGGIATGQLLGFNGAQWTPVSVAGTANQVNVSNLGSGITLSLPQDIHTGATPTFYGLSLSGGQLSAQYGGYLAGTFVGNPTITGNIVSSGGYLQASSYTGVGGSWTLPANPATGAGTIAYEQSTGTFKGFNGSTWSALGGGGGADTSLSLSTQSSLADTRAPNYGFSGNRAGMWYDSTASDLVLRGGQNNTASNAVDAIKISQSGAVTFPNMTTVLNGGTLNNTYSGNPYFSGAVTVLGAAGTGNSTTTGFAVMPSWSNSATTYSGMEIYAWDSAAASGSKLVTAGTASGGTQFSVDKSGNIWAKGSGTFNSVSITNGGTLAGTFSGNHYYSGAVTLTSAAGTGNSTTTGFAVMPTWSNSATTYAGMEIYAWDSAAASGSKLITAGTASGGTQFSVDKSGNVWAKGSGTFGGPVSFTGGLTATGGGTLSGTFSGDHYYSGAMTLTSASGTGNLATTGFAVMPTWSNSATTYAGMEIYAWDSAAASGSKLITAGTASGGTQFSVDKSGNVWAKGSGTFNSVSASNGGTLGGAFAGRPTFTGAVTVSGATGTGASVTTGFSVTPTWDAATTLYAGMEIYAWDSSYASGSKLLVAGTYTGGTQFTIDRSGNVWAKGSATFGGHVLPASDANYDLGSGTYRFRNIYASSGVIQTSDMRLKENILALAPAEGLELVMRMRPDRYTFRGQTARKMGFMAQEMAQVVPEVVHFPDPANPDDKWGINYGEVTAVLASAIQGSVQRIDGIDARLAKLGAKQAVLDRIELVGEVMKINASIEAETLKVKLVEAERARIRELEADQVRAAKVQTGEVTVYVAYGTAQQLFTPAAGGQYQISAQAEDGSYATATVLVSGNGITVVPGANQGIELVNVGGNVCVVAPSKRVKASWLRTA